MNGLTRRELARQHCNSDLRKAPSAELSVQCLDLQLRRDPEHALEVAQRALVAARLFVEMLGQRTQAVSALPRLRHALLQANVLVRKGNLTRIG